MPDSRPVGQSGVSRQDARGRWVPATPAPFYEKLPFRPWRYVCTCGVKFKSEHAYNEHYLVKHIREDS